MGKDFINGSLKPSNFSALLHNYFGCAIYPIDFWQIPRYLLRCRFRRQWTKVLVLMKIDSTDNGFYLLGCGRMSWVRFWSMGGWRFSFRRWIPVYFLDLATTAVYMLKVPFLWNPLHPLIWLTVQDTWMGWRIWSEFIFLIPQPQFKHAVCVWRKVHMWWCPAHNDQQSKYDCAAEVPLVSYKREFLRSAVNCIYSSN